MKRYGGFVAFNHKNTICALATTNPALVSRHLSVPFHVFDRRLGRYYYSWMKIGWVPTAALVRNISRYANHVLTASRGSRAERLLRWVFAEAEELKKAQGRPWVEVRLAKRLRGLQPEVDVYLVRAFVPGQRLIYDPVLAVVLEAKGQEVVWKRVAEGMARAAGVCLEVEEAERFFLEAVEAAVLAGGRADEENSEWFARLFRYGRSTRSILEEV